MRSATEGCDENARQHRVTGHSPNPGAAAGRNGFRPRRVTLSRTTNVRIHFLNEMDAVLSP